MAFSSCLRKYNLKLFDFVKQSSVCLVLLKCEMHHFAWFQLRRRFLCAVKRWKRRSVCEFGIICSRPVVVGHCDHAHKHADATEWNLMRNRESREKENDRRKRKKDQLKRKPTKKKKIERRSNTAEKANETNGGRQKHMIILFMCSSVRFGFLAYIFHSMLFSFAATVVVCESCYSRTMWFFGISIAYNLLDNLRHSDIKTFEPLAIEQFARFSPFNFCRFHYTRSISSHSNQPSSDLTNFNLFLH